MQPLLLFQGKVIEGEIQCPYHGWQYDGAGSCTLMPSTTFCQGIAVDALPCQEQQGLFWVWPCPQLAEPAALQSMATPLQAGPGVLHAGVQVGHPPLCLPLHRGVCCWQMLDNAMYHAGQTAAQHLLQCSVHVDCRFLHQCRRLSRSALPGQMSVSHQGAL